MTDILSISNLEQLKQFANKDQIIEIVIRGRKNKFRAFQKVAFNDLRQNEAKKLAQRAINIWGENNQIVTENLQLIQKVAESQNLGLIMNGLNLAATAAGFAIMYAKLDSMSKDINRQISELNHTVRQGHELHSSFEFDKVLGDYTDMLDCRRRQQPYSEEKMRVLVDQIYNVLNLLVQIFKKGISEDNSNLITSIFSLLSMLTVSLKIFDEQYYFNNKDVLLNQIVWHSSHDKWMSIYDQLNSNWFAEKLQDYAFFETSLTILGGDVYYIELMDQIIGMRNEIEDNQELIRLIDDAGILTTVRKSESQDIKASLESVVSDAFFEMDMPESLEVKDKLMEQVALL
ncbi:TPA: hypothetical protein U1B12_000661 [Streptococcus suis]|uniref:hypothetical protein n=1 Tax=Streptococcus suis TaxID=1307 RepID=UPI00209AA9E7|nr:hypothetical protein [Streptococcus suis]MCO8200576.1 hypothetical protein [Streptococcus suis]MCO8218108.1 hypothetical protein [Streptococcus suis]HEM3467535.1 hypothetical protein [Streptococcus suis]HEM3478246.1 hypothetical protein [Streptococcus suis]